MNKLIKVIFLSFLLSNACYAVGEQLTIAVNNYAPPFVLQTANKNLFGFDITMMEYICKKIQRNCVYKPLSFANILPAVEDQQADVALGAITITPERTQLVNFSIPYLTSMAAFMGRQADNQLANIEQLITKRVAVVRGGVYFEVARALGIPSNNISAYDNLETAIDALQNGEVDLVLTDEPSVQYWKIHSSGLLIPVGKPFNYGLGIGIAVSKNNTTLLQQINDAIKEYQQTETFKINYENSFGQF